MQQSQNNHKSIGKVHLNCQHLPKLSKKSIQCLSAIDYMPECSVCKKVLTSANHAIQYEVFVNLYLCLHCGAVFCQGQETEKVDQSEKEGQRNSGCVSRHGVEGCLFWSKIMVAKENPTLLQNNNTSQKQQSINKFQILCKHCGPIEYPPQPISQPSSQRQQRFLTFITPHLQSLAPVLSKKFIQNFELLSSPTPDFQPFGLKNLGNTCYLNSVLQCLYYTDQFRELCMEVQSSQKGGKWQLICQDKHRRKQIQYFYDEVLEKEADKQWHVVSNNKKNRAKGREAIGIQDLQIKDNKLNKALSTLFSQIAVQTKQPSPKIPIFSPIQLLQNLSIHCPKYTKSHQQDAEQVLTYLLNIWHYGHMLELYKNRKDQRDRLTKIQAILGIQKISPIQQIFGSYVGSYICCQGCKVESWSLDFMYHYMICLDTHQQQKWVEKDIDTPISNIRYPFALYYLGSQEPAPKKCILSPLFSAERLTNRVNYYKCEKCSHLTAVKKLYIISPPEILIISIKRFESSKKTKISKHIQFQQRIDIDGYTLREKDDVQRYRYELFGVIVHKGDTIDSGHYVAFVKVGKTAWFEMSDEKVCKVLSKEVYRQEAYVLFYRKYNQQS